MAEPPALLPPALQLHFTPVPNLCCLSKLRRCKRAACKQCSGLCPPGCPCLKLLRARRSRCRCHWPCRGCCRAGRRRRRCCCFCCPPRRRRCPWPGCWPPPSRPCRCRWPPRRRARSSPTGTCRWSAMRGVRGGGVEPATKAFRCCTHRPRRAAPHAPGRAASGRPGLRRALRAHVDALVGGDAHRAPRNVQRAQPRLVHERARRGDGEARAAADGCVYTARGRRVSVLVCAPRSRKQQWQRVACGGLAGQGPPHRERRAQRAPHRARRLTARAPRRCR